MRLRLRSLLAVGMTETEVDLEQQRTLVTSVLAGDPQAVDEFSVRMRCIPKFVRILARRVGLALQANEVEEIAQDSAVAVFESLERFESKAILEAWVFRICDFTMRNWARARRRRARFVALEGDFETTQARPDEELCAREAADDYLREIGGVEADVLRLKHCENMSFPEIARRLNRPLGTMKSYYYRGLERLRARMQRRDA